MKVRQAVAELIGTFMLVLFGTAVVVVAKGNVLAIGLAFGLTVTIGAYTVGAISGGHFNPAVTTAMWINKKIDAATAILYVIAQFVGAILASGVLKMFVGALGQSTTALGQTDFPKLTSPMAFFVEMLVTALFIFMILLVTSDEYGNPALAGLVIGLALAILVMVAVNLTGASLNPARSFGPALFAMGSAMSHYWVYLLAPEVGAVIAAFLARWMLKK